MVPQTARSRSKTIFHYFDYNPQGTPPVLLLHGLGADGGSWGYQIPLLCEAGFRPIAPDLPGFGKSIPDEGRWTIAATAADVAGFIVGLGIESIMVVGISLGGTVALQFGLDFPQLVERMILINTFACLRPKRFDEMGYLVGRFIVTNLRGKEYQAEAVARRLFPKPDQSDLRKELTQRILQSDERIYRQAMQSLALFDVRKRLVEIRIPTFVISGQNDTTVPLPNQSELANGIAGARQVIIPDAGHAVIVDQYARFNHELIGILSTILPKR